MVWSLWRHQQVIVTSTAEHKRSEWDTGLMSEDRRFYRHWWICYAHVYAITQVLFWCLFIYQTYRERINGPPLECVYYSTYFQSTWKILLILVEINSNYRLIWMLVPFSWNEKHHFFRYLVHANLYNLIPLQIHREFIGHRWPHDYAYIDLYVNSLCSSMDGSCISMFVFIYSMVNRVWWVIKQKNSLTHVPCRITVTYVTQFIGCVNLQAVYTYHVYIINCLMQCRCTCRINDNIHIDMRNLWK